MPVILGLSMALDWGAREAMLFAGAGFLIGGLDDLAVDLVFLWVRFRAWIVRALTDATTLDALPASDVPRHLAVFVAAWDESAVIGAMLRAALARFDYPDYRLHVGVYPNDRDTIDAVASVAVLDSRVHMVIGGDDGPTTKAACLNAVWHALLRSEAQGAPRAAAIVIHDAEDMVDPAELRVFDAWLDRYAVVQLPVIPLSCAGSPMVSGHYLDEFAEAHAKQLVVRQALGAGLPLAGTGCAIRRDAIDSLAAARGGQPFDAASLVEDYEMGLTIAAMGGQGALARVRTVAGGPLIAVRAHFPDTIDAAVRQKARWMAGIALAGWDRIGWSRALDWRDHWMRMRDRRAPIAVIVLVAAYAALVLWALSFGMHALSGVERVPIAWPLVLLLRINGLLLLWRLASRAFFTGRSYGTAEALRSVPRAFVGNIIALLAARRAFVRYIAMLRGAAAVWEKTARIFPQDLAEPGPVIPAQRSDTA
ncbi:MAG: glycosyl transferase family protein [Sphingomonas sp.]